MQRIILVGVISGILLWGCQPKEAVEQAEKKKLVPKDTVQKVQRDRYGLAVDSMKVSNHQVKRNESLYLILNKLNFSAQEIYTATQKARDVIDVENMKPGQPYRTYASTDSSGEVSKMVWQPNPLEYVVFNWKDSLEVYRAARPLSSELAVASGEISSSLYQKISEEGASPLLAYKMAEVFAWQINFFGLREGDSFKTLYNKRYIGNTFLGVGEVLAAEFTHRGKTYRAYKFSKGDLDGYFTEKGESVEKALLKAPFKFNQRISSPFSRNRYHPILKRRRPHYGIDYAAPYGTPVLSVGDGVVTRAGYDNGSGYIVKIRHNSTYETAYMHLSDFADGISEGTTVEQGQIIAYVGNSGMSTGSHLHYSLYKNNRPVNARSIDLPSSKSVPDSLMKAFKKVRDSLDQQLRARLDTSEESVTKQMVTRTE